MPDFFFSEITNILWKHIQKKELSLSKAKESLKILKQVDFEIFASYDLVDQALKISVQVRQAIYDCIYLALALDHSCQMLTADERFINAVRQNSNVDSIVWLGALSKS